MTKRNSFGSFLRERRIQLFTTSFANHRLRTAATSNDKTRNNTGIFLKHADYFNAKYRNPQM